MGFTNVPDWECGVGPVSVSATGLGAWQRGGYHRHPSGKSDALICTRAFLLFDQFT